MFSKVVLQCLMAHLNLKDLILLGLTDRENYEQVGSFLAPHMFRKWRRQKKTIDECLLMSAQLGNEILCRHYLHRGAFISDGVLKSAEQNPTLHEYLAYWFRFLGAGGESLKIRKWKWIPRKMHSCVIIGTSTAAARLVQDMLDHNKDLIDDAIIVGEHAISDYRGFMPEAFVFDEYDEDVLNNNCTQYDGYVKNMVYNARNYEFLHIHVSQNAAFLPKNILSTMQFTFLSRSINRDERRQVYACYGGIFPSYESFLDVYLGCSGAGNWMVIDNRSGRFGSTLEGNVFWC
jgi:hypothetical protein